MCVQKRTWYSTRHRKLKLLAEKTVEIAGIVCFASLHRRLQNVTQAGHASPEGFGIFAAGAAAHRREGFTRRCIVGRFPNRLFAQAFLAEAALVGSADVAAESLPDERLVLSAKFLQIGFLAGV